MRMDRFREPTAADDRARCQGPCGEMFHHEDLDRRGFCYGGCSPFEDEDDERIHVYNLPDQKGE